jgi:hypothetical protein
MHDKRMNTSLTATAAGVGIGGLPKTNARAYGIYAGFCGRILRQDSAAGFARSLLCVHAFDVIPNGIYENCKVKCPFQRPRLLCVTMRPAYLDIKRNKHYNQA